MRTTYKRPSTSTYTRERSEEAEDNGCLDTGRGVADWGLSRGRPLIGQVTESDEEHKGPQEMKGHVRKHVMLS